MQKEYENVDVKVSEEYGFITISKYGSPVSSYQIKNDDEKEFLKDRYSSVACTRLLFFLTALIAPIACVGISSLLKMGILKSLSQEPVLILFGMFFYLIASGICVFFEGAILRLAVSLFNLEKAAKDDKPLKFIFAAVVILVVLVLLSLIPIEAGYF